MLPGVGAPPAWNPLRIRPAVLRKTSAILLLASLLALGPGAAWGQGSSTMELRDNVFVPDQMTVKVGDSIEFRNTGQLPHTATARDNSFDTGELNAGQSRSITFRRAGNFPIVCIYHDSLGMVGRIVVEAASGPVGAATPSPASPAPASPATPAASGEQESPSPDPGEEEAASPKPPTQKYFPAAALGVFVLFALAAGAGYLRTAMKISGRRG